MTDAAQRARAAFEEALEIPAREEREAFVAERCAGDEEMAQRVRELLGAHEEAGEFLKDQAPLSPEIEAELARLKPEEAGERIGPYKLLQQIGEGGFGTVWMAEQEQPVRRRVALKIVKLGMDTKEVITRFEQERQALAMMEHPNIARVFDAGMTQHGRPFFVMELVRGMKITEYCDEQQLSTDERIGLFVHVCQAVQHAHQKGIIHRDLKPSNILVTINDGEPVAKVIDFGVAKATQGRLTDGTLFTQFEQMVGTPLYMSPEQAELTSLDIDTRSDIYSLGVLLYELLTGRTPIDTSTMARAGKDEIRRLIREVDPPRPSARVKTLAGNELTTTAKRRHTDAAKLPGALRGDLDWIVMKCLEKDRKRRYDTANGLALDLQRHLANEIVTARPPTAAYLLGKLIRRNKLAFAAGAAIAASLVIGITVSVWQAVRATHAETKAVTALDELRATAPAFAEQARSLAAKERFDEALEKLAYATKLRPDAPEYLIARGDLLQCQFRLAEAAAAYRAALALRPGDARSKAGAALCEELLAAPAAQDGRLTRESLGKLHVAMQQQQRPAAELMPVARLLGEEKKLLVEYWLTRLKDLPVSAEKPLEKRLTVRDDGRLALDLSDTKVIDLSPLTGAPLATLNMSKSKDLIDLSPLRGIDLVELNISGTSVADLAPLREMHTLERLQMSDSQVSDLAALNALRLKSLTFRDCPVSDLNPIRKMPLEEISLRETRVADLSPLIGMPIKSIDLSMAPVLDFSPLAQLPLEKCYLQRNRITDLVVLRGKRLKELVLWACADARNYAVLPEIKTLELLLLPSEYRDLPAEDYEAIGSLRDHPALRQLGSEIMNQMGYAATGSKDIFWQDWDREQTFVPALRKSGIKFSLLKLPTGSYDLSIEGQPLRDLSILKGAPIAELSLYSCPFSDLTPIHDLKLERLRLASNLVTDLSPLRGMPIKTLYLSGSKISDLSPLAGLPLRELYLESCPNVADVAALAEIPTLEKVTVPIQARNIEALHKLTRLQMLGFNRSANALLPGTTADEFWKEYDGNGWLSRLRDSGFPPKIITRLIDGTWEVNLWKADLRDLGVIRGAPISILTLDETPVVDLTPLVELPLKALSVRGTPLGDLSFLRTSRCRATLEELWLLNTKVADLAPLSECKSLKRLDLSATPGANLEPLGGLKLQTLYLNGSQVRDLSPLAGMPLEYLYLNDTQVRDLSPLAGMPLKCLIFERSAVTNVAALRDCRALETIILPAGVQDIDGLRALPKLQRISYHHAASNWAIPSLTAAEFWKDYDQQGWLRTLRESGLKTKTLQRLDDGTWEVNLEGSAISDLTILSGARISILWLGNTAVSDLTPLRGMPLKQVWFYNTNVTDLTPLHGMALNHLNLGSTHVTDLSPLRGMPLTELRVGGCPDLVDLSPIEDAAELTNVTLPPNAKDIRFLRGFPNLERLSYNEDASNSYRPDKTAAEFWKEYDKQGWAKALRESGFKFKRLKEHPDGWWEVDLSESGISDLTILHRAPIGFLHLWNTPVADLTPLRGMVLRELTLSGTKVADLSPLMGAPLETLIVSDTKVADISALRGMPLISLRLHGCKELTDLAPLAECKELKNVVLPPNAKDIEVLRALPKLERISFHEDPKNNFKPDKSAAEFWQEYDAKKQ